MGQKTLVIGGTGFIGSALCLELRSRGRNPIAVTKPRAGSTPLVRDGIPTMVLEQYDEPSFLRLISDADPDHVHFLSGNPSPENSTLDPYIDLQQTNLPVTCLLEAMRKTGFTGSLWFASTVAVYGKSDATPLHEEGPCAPLSVYGLSKLFAEQLLSLYSVQHGLHCGSYRLFSTYGPGLRRQMVFDIITRLLTKPPHLRLFGSGTEGRDLSYVDDQATAIASLAEKVTPSGNIFNLASGHFFEVREVVSAIVELLGAATRVEWEGARRPFDGAVWRADVSKLKALGIDYPTPLEQGLRRTIDWCLEQK